MLDLKSFVINDELVIDKPHWHKLNNSHTQEEIKEAISEVIQDLPLPLENITEEEAKKDFDELVRLDSRKLFNKGSLLTKAEYRYELSNWFMKNSLVGKKSSNYFHQLARWKTQHARYPSPYRSWTETKFHKTFSRALWSLNLGRVDNKTLRQAIQMTKYVASQYPPAVAKGIYNMFGGKNVLDFSMGWGDRLAGFHASNAESYVGIDPNVEVLVNYPLQNVLYNTGKRTEFINAPAEDVDLEDRKFDMVFTSPPYFHVERYSFGENEETQSWKRYGKTIDSWLDGFLYPTLNNCWEALEDGGTMIINIADVHATNNGTNEYIQICDPMNDFISRLPNACYSGCFGLRLSRRPGQNMASKHEPKIKTFVEPMWVWRKKDTRSLDEIIDSSFPLSRFF